MRVAFRCLHCGGRIYKEIPYEDASSPYLWLWLDCGCGLPQVITDDGEIKDLPLKVTVIG